MESFLVFVFPDAIIKICNEMAESNVMASAKAAFLVIGILLPRILRVLRKPDLVRKFIETLKGFYWSRPMLSKLGSKPINDIMQCVRASDLPLDEKDKLRQMLKVSYFDQSTTPPIELGGLGEFDHKIQFIRSLLLCRMVSDHR